MAENKKGFVLYADQKFIFDDLTNEEAGILIKHIFSYVNDENPTLNDRFLNMAFKPIKLQLKRDLVKYEGVKERNSANARKRWDATASSGMPKVPNSTKNADKDNDIDKGNDTDKDKDIYRAFAHLKLSTLEFNNLVKAGNSKELIDDILDRIENFAGNKKYKSLYMTCLNWIKTDKGFNADSVGKKDYLLTSPQGKHKFSFTEDELKAKKLSGYWKEQHELW